MKKQLALHIQRYASPSDDELEQFVSTLDSISIKAKDHLHRAGDVCNYQYFVNQGCLRSYFIDKIGNEKTVNFSIENWWVSDYASYHSQTAGNLFIQAIENAEVLRISRDTLAQALSSSLELNKYFRIIGDRTRMADQRRVEFMFRLSGREMYDVFSAANPEFIQRVPQYMLASYLGFTPEFLSKIRKQKAEEGN